jgi:murein DD-endopeptidase MepM/ murein hydrolase activator NlpD
VKRESWIWIGLGSAAGALLLFGRKLGSPVEVSGAPEVTSHGFFGADRAGPPAHQHQGVDLVAPAGSHVLAVGDGEIIHANPGLGNVVRVLQLDTPGGWGFGRRVHRIVYADLGKPLVEPGDRVRKGDPVALVDKAGFVHFAVKERRTGGDVFIDPKEAGFSYREVT